MRFLSAAHQRSLRFLATWRKAGVPKSRALERSSVMRVTERVRGSGLKPKVLPRRNPQLAEISLQFPLGQRSDRQPDLTGAAQHPEIERRAITSSCASVPFAKQPATTTPCLHGTKARPRANGDVQEKIACGVCNLCNPPHVNAQANY